MREGGKPRGRGAKDGKCQPEVVDTVLASIGPDLANNWLARQGRPGPFLAAWLWICLLVAWRSSDYCRYANRLRREKGRSILSLVNRAPWFLYMWGEVVLVPIWMSNGILC